MIPHKFLSYLVCVNKKRKLFNFLSSALRVFFFLRERFAEKPFCSLDCLLVQSLRTCENNSQEENMGLLAVERKSMREMKTISGI